MLRKIVLGIGLIFWVLLHLLVVVFGEVEPGISLLLWFLILLVVVTAAYFEAINGASGPVVHATAFAILHVSNAIMALPDYISAPENVDNNVHEWIVVGRTYIAHYSRSAVLLSLLFRVLQDYYDNVFGRREI